jgi:DNA-binding MarR family transcriptional regulator
MSGKAALYRIGPSRQGPLDKANLISSAEDLERRTKEKGRVNGALGVPGLAVLRAMMRRTNRDTGFCRASYADLQQDTGLSRQAITDALRRLEAADIISRERKSAGRNSRRKNVPNSP